MLISEFIQYKEFCPICSSSLILEGFVGSNPIKVNVKYEDNRIIFFLPFDRYHFGLSFGRNDDSLFVDLYNHRSKPDDYFPIEINADRYVLFVLRRVCSSGINCYSYLSNPILMDKNCLKCYSNHLIIGSEDFSIEEKGMNYFLINDFTKNSAILKINDDYKTNNIKINSIVNPGLGKEIILNKLKSLATFS